MKAQEIKFNNKDKNYSILIGTNILSLLPKRIKLIFIISSMLFVGILMYKTHDDFFYYHFPYTISLIEFKKIFGLGNLEHHLPYFISILYFISQ